MPVKPTTPKHTTENLGDKLIISIPGLEKNGPLIFLTWLILLVLIGVTFYTAVMIIEAPGGLIGIAATVPVIAMVALVFPLYRVAKNPTGKEVIEITSQSIKIDRVAFGRHAPDDFLAEYVKDLRVSSSNTNSQLLAMMSYQYILRGGLQIGSLAFDYGAKTYRFGGNVDEAESKMILAEIQQKFPQYKN